MRAQFYSIIAMLLVIPFVLFFVYFATYRGGQGSIYEKIISDQIHQVEKSLELDFERALSTSGKRSLIAAGDFAVLNGEYLDNAKLRLRELMENGTIYGNESFLMVNNTMVNWTSRILATPTNFNITMGYSNINLKHFSPFWIETEATINISVSDNSDTIKIIKEDMKKNVLVSLYGLEDPIFPLNTNGAISRVIRESPFSYRAMKILTFGSNSSGSCSGNMTLDKFLCDTTKILVTENVSEVNPSCFAGLVVGDSINLTGSSNCFVTGNSDAVYIINNTIGQYGYRRIYIDHETQSVWSLPIEQEIENGYYIPGNGPDFLKRLEGDTSQSENGLESFVNAQELQSFGIPVKENQVSLDYLYFSGQDYIGYGVRGLSDWFKINRTIAEGYNLTELLED